MNNQNLAERIAETQELLSRLKEEAKALDLEELHKKYGQDVTCKNCRYSCTVQVVDFHEACLGGLRLHSCGPCKFFKPHNELSKYIDEHGYTYTNYDGLECLLEHLLEDTEGLLDREDLHPLAIGILKLIDGE